MSKNKKMRCLFASFFLFFFVFFSYPYILILGIGLIPLKV
jgi:hypothetical protein